MSRELLNKFNSIVESTVYDGTVDAARRVKLAPQEELLKEARECNQWVNLIAGERDDIYDKYAFRVYKDDEGNHHAFQKCDELETRPPNRR